MKSGATLLQAEAESFATPWGHIKLLINKCKGDRDKAMFYVHKVVENNWSRAVLGNYIATDLYERQGKAVGNFAATLPTPQGDLVQEITRDPYGFDFLTLRERYDERELKDALMDNITKFLLELGTGFAFVGREYRVQIGQNERWMDMLFYHIRLRCYVVLEVKVTDFEPAFMGQLGTYVVAVNHQLKADEGNRLPQYRVAEGTLIELSQLVDVDPLPRDLAQVLRNGKHVDGAERLPPVEEDVDV